MMNVETNGALPVRCRLEECRTTVDVPRRLSTDSREFKEYMRAAKWQLYRDGDEDSAWICPSCCGGGQETRTYAVTVTYAEKHTYEVRADGENQAKEIATALYHKSLEESVPDNCDYDDDVFIEDGDVREV